MNLKSYVEQYVQYHQALGKVFATQARILRAFVRKFDPTRTVDDLTMKDVEAFIRASGTSRYWYIKYSTLAPSFARPGHLDTGTSNTARSLRSFATLLLAGMFDRICYHRILRHVGLG